jgi:hypothetical protein
VDTRRRRLTTIDGGGWRKRRRDCKEAEAQFGGGPQTGSQTRDQVGPFAARAEGEGEMTIPRPQEWTEAEVHRLRMLAKRKVSANSIAKLLGRNVVRTKALELRLILSKKVKVKAKEK